MKQCLSIAFFCATFTLCATLLHNDTSAMNHPAENALVVQNRNYERLDTMAVLCGMSGAISLLCGSVMKGFCIDMLTNNGSDNTAWIYQCACDYSWFPPCDKVFNSYDGHCCNYLAYSSTACCIGGALCTMISCCLCKYQHRRHGRCCCSCSY